MARSVSTGYCKAFQLRRLFGAGYANFADHPLDLLPVVHTSPTGRRLSEPCDGVAQGCTFVDSHDSFLSFFNVERLLTMNKSLGNSRSENGTRYFSRAAP